MLWYIGDYYCYILMESFFVKTVCVYIPDSMDGNSNFANGFLSFSWVGCR